MSITANWALDLLPRIDRFGDAACSMMSLLEPVQNNSQNKRLRRKPFVLKKMNVD
jgi:hypothetical protein